jgi:hypothetical protein
MICVKCKKEFKTPGDLKAHKALCLYGKLAGNTNEATVEEKAKAPSEGINHTPKKPELKVVSKEKKKRLFPGFRKKDK